MFTENERDYFEEMLKAQFREVHSKLDGIHSEVKKTNGRVNKLDDVTIPEIEKELNDLKNWRATSIGHWKGITKTIMIIWFVVAFIGGVIATYLWH